MPDIRNTRQRHGLNTRWGLVLAACILLSLWGCGGGSAGGNGPAVQDQAQTITFGTAPALSPQGTAQVAATASSGLAVRYASSTSGICTVDASSGLVTGLAMGTCIITADQAGNDQYAPAAQDSLHITITADPHQTIQFAAAPVLTLGGSATVAATASSGLPVVYASSTPAVCAVDARTGLVTDLAVGTCTITADQPGDAFYLVATQVAQSIDAVVPASVTVPEAPIGVAATTGSAANQVLVSIGAANSGGSAITRYTVVSSPGGFTASGSTLPITVACPTSCAGEAFRVYASNVLGDGATSAPADVITRYQVVETFHEPDTQPRDSIFTGTFTFNATTGAVTALTGTLTESMTGSATGAAPGYGMTELALSHQLSSTYSAGLGGRLVATFLLNTTATLSTMNGGDGWSPGTGYALYSGFPAANPGNAYALIFVNTADPTAPLTPAQIDKLAYADCAPGGMMGATCMTGTTVAGYGSIGSMSGYPVSQIISKLP